MEMEMEATPRYSPPLQPSFSFSMAIVSIQRIQLITVLLEKTRSSERMSYTSDSPPNLKLSHHLTLPGQENSSHIPCLKQAHPKHPDSPGLQENRLPERHARV